MIITKTKTDGLFETRIIFIPLSTSSSNLLFIHSLYIIILFSLKLLAILKIRIYCKIKSSYAFRKNREHHREFGICFNDTQG